MSSSDKFPTWDLFADREAPAAIDLLSPSSEAAALLQVLRGAVDTALREAGEAGEEAGRPLADLAVFIAQLGIALELYKSVLEPKVHRHLRVLKDQMLDVLERAGLHVNAPLDRPFDEVADSVDVIGWRHHERFSAQVVAEVLEPIVTRGNKLIRPGKVIMGAPLEAAPDPPQENSVKLSQNTNGESQ